MELLEEFKSSEYYLYVIWAYYITMNLIGFGMAWLNALYREKYKKQIHWIVFVILNFLGGFVGVVFGIDKFKYKKGDGIILFSIFFAVLVFYIFNVNYLM